jgi:hypothetical protein
MVAYSALMLLTLPTVAGAQRSWQWLSPTRVTDIETTRGLEVQIRFPVKNLGYDTLYIETIRPDCSCTAADWPSMGIAPNETADVVISYDAAHRGAFRKKIAVWVKGSRRAEKLYISGRVI